MYVCKYMYVMYVYSCIVLVSKTGLLEIHAYTCNPYIYYMQYMPIPTVHTYTHKYIHIHVIHTYTCNTCLCNLIHTYTYLINNT